MMNTTLQQKNKEYWEKTYKQQSALAEPSLFAQKVKFYVKEKSVIEFGCGSGRDAIYLSQDSKKYLAIDITEDNINYLKNKYVIPNLEWECDDFTNLKDVNDKYDIVYSRFTLHSISSYQEKNVISWCTRNLNSQGYFFIEARGLNNEIYGKGIKVQNENHAFIYNDHYRRFIDINSLKDSLSKEFNLLLCTEKKDFAPFLDENQTFIRVVAQKI